MIGYEINFERFSESDGMNAIKVLQALSQPATAEQIVGELGRLRLLTKSRAENQEDVTAQIGIYVEAIQDAGYPIDVVKQARKDCVELNTFWPSWHEFDEHCRHWFLKRSSLLNALKRHYGV